MYYNMKNNKIFVKDRQTIYKAKQTITIPLGVFETAESKEEIEDWLLAHDHEFIERMRKARKNDLEEKGIPWEQVKKRLNIK